MEKLLENKIALITGANRGIGAGIARQYAANGAVLVLAGRNEEAMKEAVRIHRENGAQADYVLADVTKEDQVNRMVDEVIGKFGRIDILVNNAGISKEIPLLDMSVLSVR